MIISNTKYLFVTNGFIFSILYFMNSQLVFNNVSINYLLFINRNIY